jgi:hypothetical protein
LFICRLLNQQNPTNSIGEEEEDEHQGNEDEQLLVNNNNNKRKRQSDTKWESRLAKKRKSKCDSQIFEFSKFDSHKSQKGNFDSLSTF